MKQRAFISNAIDSEKLPFISTEEIQFGKAHYSWKVIASLYQQGIETAGLESRKVIRPEIYQTEIAQQTLGLRHDDIHIAIKPIEHIRPLYGVKNIFICGWEFPEFSEQAYDNNPLLNHISILKHADQIWCWSDFTTNNLKKYGVHTAITMPPPVLIRHPEEKESILNINALALNTSRAVNANDIKTLGQVLQQHRKNTVFISVLNPFDRRKHIKMMLTAFQLALNKNPNMVLIIKLVIDNKLTTLGNIQEILDVHYDYQNVSDHIIFISETLTDSQMTSLNQIARFYLCTSSTEGLNLPMIEAMSQGVVPISTKATAMADYIHEHNAVVIKNDKTLTDGPYHLLHTHLSTTHFPPLLSSLVDSLISAADMSSDKYTDLSNQAKSDVYEKYNMDAFIKKLNSLGIKQ